MAQDNTLLAQYPRQQVVQDRNWVGLLNWAASITAQPLPTNRAAVKLRLLAERIPAQTTVYMQRTLAYFLQDPATVAHIRDYLNSYNSPEKETELASEIEAVIATFVPRFAETEIPDAQVDQWLTDHGAAQ